MDPFQAYHSYLESWAKFSKHINIICREIQYQRWLWITIIDTHTVISHALSQSQVFTKDSTTNISIIEFDKFNLLHVFFIVTVTVWSFKCKCKWSYLIVGPTPASVLWCAAHQVTISPVLCWSVSVSDHCLCSASSPCVDPQLELPWLPARLAAPASSPSPVPAWFCKYTTHSHSSTLPIQQTGSFPSILSNYCWFQSHVLWLHLFIISIYCTFYLARLG